VRARLLGIGLVAVCTFTGQAMAQQSAAATAGGAAAAQAPKPGSIAGRVVVAPGIPVNACQATIDSAQLKVDCSKGGAFVFKQVQPGSYDVHIVVNSVGDVTLSTGVGDGQATWLGEVHVGVPGSVAGRVTADNSSDLDVTVIGVPELGLYTQPNVTGGYLLAGVPAGNWNLTIFPPGQNPAVRQISVPPGQPLRGVDFQITTAPAVTPGK
jgi:hypothetical protein